MNPLLTSGIGAVIAVIVALFWARISKVLKALDELGDVIELIPKILEDKKLEPAEIAELKKEFGEAMAAFKAILK